MELSSSTVTASYVRQLGEALGGQREQLAAAAVSEKRLLQRLHEEELRGRVLEARSRLGSISRGQSGEVVEVVSSWVPPEHGVSLACCLKIGQDWLVIEESTPNRQVSQQVKNKFSTCVSNDMLDEIVLMCGISEGGVLKMNPVDSDMLHFYGYDDDYDSAAVVVCAQCVWLMIGISCEEMVRSLSGFYDVLEYATEVMIRTVRDGITHDDERMKFNRMRSSLLVTEALLACGDKEGGERNLLRGWEGLPNVFEDAVASMMKVTCDIVLFINNAKVIPEEDPDVDDEYQYLSPKEDKPKNIKYKTLGATTTLSALQGPLHVNTASLTKTAISESVNILVCNDPNNKVRHSSIDCGVCEHKSNRDDHNERGFMNLAILPLWTESDHEGGECLIHNEFCVSGAIIFRKQFEDHKDDVEGVISDEDVKFLTNFRHDNFGKVAQWLETHLYDFVRNVVSNQSLFTPEIIKQRHQRAQQRQHAKSNGVSKPDHEKRPRQCDEKNHLPLCRQRELLQYLLKYGFCNTIKNHAEHVISFLTSSYNVDWVVIIESMNLSSDCGSVGSPLILIDDHGERSSLQLPQLSIDKNPLTQTIKYFLNAYNSELQHFSEVNVLNHILTDYESNVDSGDGSLFINSLLNKRSQHRLPDLAEGLNALLPLHIFATTLSCRDYNEDKSSDYIIIGGREWRTINADEIASVNKESLSIFATLDECRKKDSLHDDIARVNRDMTILQNENEALKSSNAHVDEFCELLKSNEKLYKEENIDLQGGTLCHDNNSERNAARLLLTALHFTLNNKSIFPHNSSGATKLILCAKDSITGHHWQLVDSGSSRIHVRGIQWQHLEADVHSIIEWPNLSASSESHPGTETTIGSFRKVVGGSSGECYLLHKILSNSSQTLTLYLLIICPDIDDVQNTLSPFIARWLSSLDAFVIKHHKDLIEAGHDMQSRLPSSTVAGVITSTISSTSSLVNNELHNLKWLHDELANAPNAGGRWARRQYAYLSNLEVWDSAIRRCCYGKVNLLVPLLESQPTEFISLSGKVVNSGEYVDLLHVDNRVPSAMQELMSSQSAHKDDIIFNYECHNASLQIYHHNCPFVRKTLQSYLQGKGNFNLNIMTETLLKYTYKDVGSGFRNVHVFLLLPNDLLFTYDDLSMLTSCLTATLSPIALIQAHNSLRDHVTRILKLFPLSSGSIENQDNSKQIGEATHHIAHNSHRNHYTTIYDMPTTSITPVSEMAHSCRLSSSLSFLNMIPDLFNASGLNSPPQKQQSFSGAAVHFNSDMNDRRKDQEKFKFELVDGHVFCSPGVDCYQSHAGYSENDNSRILKKIAAVNYFKQNGGNFKKTFSGLTSLMSVPDEIFGNCLQCNVVSNNVKIDILPEKFLSGCGMPSDECSDEHNRDVKEELYQSDDDFFDEDIEDNPLGSVQIIRIAFFHENNMYCQSGPLTTSPHNTSSFLTHEKVIVFIRGIVVKTSSDDEHSTKLNVGRSTLQDSTRLRSSVPSRNSTTTSIHNMSYVDEQPKVMVSSIIPLTELHILAEVTGHILHQVADLVHAANTEHRIHSDRVGRYHEEMEVVIAKIEDVFVHLSNPKLIHVNVENLSLLSTSSPQIGKENLQSHIKALSSQSKSNKHFRIESLESIVDREMFFRNSLSHQSNRSTTVNDEQGTLHETSTLSQGLRAFLEREFAMDKDFSLKTDMFITETVEKATSICRRITDCFAAEVKQADKVRSLESSLSQSEATIINLQQELEEANQNVNAFLVKVAERIAPIIRMMHQQVSEECNSHDNFEEEEKQEQFESEDEVMKSLNVMQRTIVFYRGLLEHIIANSCEVKNLHSNLAHWILEYTARFDSRYESNQDLYLSSEQMNKFQSKLKLYWPNNHCDNNGIDCQQLKNLVVSPDIANSDAFTWCVRSLSESTSNNVDGAHCVPRGKRNLRVTYIPIVATFKDSDNSASPRLAVLEEIHDKSQSLFRQEVSDNISAPKILFSLIRLLVSRHYDYVSVQRAISGAVLPHVVAEVKPQVSDTSINYSGNSVSYEVHVVRASSTGLLDKREQLITKEKLGLEVDMLRRKSSSWYQTAQVSQKLFAFCAAFQSPSECLERVDHMEVAVERERDLMKLCEVLIALGGGICNVGIVFQDRWWGGECGTGLQDVYLRGMVYYGCERYCVVASQATSSRIFTLPSSNDNNSFSCNETWVRFQSSILQALLDSRSIGMNATITSVADHCEGCYVVCVPLLDAGTVQGYAILEYSHLPDLTLSSTIQALSLSLLRKWEYFDFVRKAKSSQQQLDTFHEKLATKESEKQELAASLTSLRMRWQAYYDFEQSLQQSASAFSRMTSLSSGIEGSFISGGNHCDEETKGDGDRFDISKDWLELWAEGASPDTQNVFHGRSENKMPSPFASPTSVKTPLIPNDESTSAALLSHIKKTLSKIGKNIASILRSGVPIKSSAAVHIDSETLGRMSICGGVRDAADRYSDMEAVEVGALCLLTKSNVVAPQGVLGHPSEPLLFIPIALTDFSPNTDSEDSSLIHVSGTVSEDDETQYSGCGWVLVISFVSNSQLHTFTDRHASSEVDNTSSQETQTCEAVSSLEVVTWLSHSLRKWIKMVEVQFVESKRRGMASYSRAVFCQSTNYLTKLSFLNRHPSLKRQMVSNASVAAAMSHLFQSLSESAEYVKHGNLHLVAVRMHWKESSTSKESLSPVSSSYSKWMTINQSLSSSSPSEGIPPTTPNDDRDGGEDDELDSLNKYLKHLLWSVMPSPISATQLDQTWKTGRCDYFCDSKDGYKPWNCSGAVRQLYALRESGQKVIIEIVLRVRSNIYSSFRALHVSQRHFQHDARVNDDIDFAQVAERDWNMLSHPYFSSELESTLSEKSLIQGILALIPCEISLMIKHMHFSLQNKEKICELKLSESNSFHRAQMLMHCLKELYSTPNKGYLAILKGVEDVISNLECVKRVDIQCHDLQPLHSSVPSQALTTPQNKHARGTSSKSNSRSLGRKRSEMSPNQNFQEKEYGTARNNESKSTSPTSLVTYSSSGSRSIRVTSRDRVKDAVAAEREAFLEQRRRSHKMKQSRSMESNGRLDLASLRTPPTTENKNPHRATFSKLNTRESYFGDESYSEDSDNSDFSENSEVDAAVVGPESSPSFINKRNQSKRPTAKYQKQRESGVIKYMFDFQCKEVEGSLTVFTSAELNQNDTTFFTVISTAIAKRVYDLCRHEKDRKVITDLHQEINASREQVEARQNELEAALVTQQRHLDALHDSELSNEKLKGLLRAEGTALEGVRRLKRESDKHMSEVLEGYKTEFESRESKLSKAVEVLKKRCMSLEKQIKDEMSAKLKAEGDAQRYADRVNDLEEKRRSLADEMVEAKVDSSGKISELESRLQKCQDEIVQCQKGQVSAEAKVKAQASLFEQKYKTAKEKKALLEQEVAASRTSCARLKQQLDSTSRSLALCQKELETLKQREIQHHQNKQISREQVTITTTRKGEDVKHSPI